MYAGLALTAAAALIPLVDVATIDSLTGHVRGAYPRWSGDLVADDRNAIVIYLSVIGVLGVASWLWAIRAVTRRKHSMRRTVSVLFAFGAGAALFNLTWSAAAYDRVIPALYGVIGLLPALAGLATVVLVWRLDRPTVGGAAGKSGRP
ncbi:hypothetical protein [Streptomyces sp. NEAU-S7GS2]|uniref:hypothetical protein n=1 Tax=Streptomyces sp. NEAU-S7GS2 TaxID=2202000 RepID=UPI00194FCC15|nr:hypothetical protein [Streptomyces sp. NEAU-S7GS2]